jgi:hypothetical protein
MNKKKDTKRLKFNVRSAFSADVLPFVESVSKTYKDIDDSIPIVSYLEKSNVYKPRNFGKAPPLSYSVIDSVKNIIELTYEDGKKLVYEKVIHLLDAYRVLRFGEVYPEDKISKRWTQSDVPFMNNPNNQAYVDIASSFLASSIHEQFNSPHFTKFYQSFRAISEKYKYNITEDISSYRYNNWFWNGYDKGYFTLELREKGSETLIEEDDMLQLLRPLPELCGDSSDEDSEDSDTSTNKDTESSSEEETASINSSSVEELAAELNDVKLNSDLESVQDFNCDDTLPTKLIYRHSSRTKTSNTDTSTESSEFDAYTVHAILKDMPVIVQHTEHMSGNLEDLLDDEEFEEAWETKWTAWLFQIVIALYQLQTHLNLVHNDLHTNNILWKDTDQEYYYYKLKNSIFKIPTYGKRFVIIDFGRATFVFNGVEIASSDFRDGADAEGQYNFGPWRNRNEPILRPNPSFDLCRLSCSLTRILYPRNPVEKVNAEPISRDGKYIVKETVSPLFNMLWTWVTDTEEINVLEDKDGDEKFPGFDLYQHIALYCKNAKPEDWIEKPIFQSFRIQTTDAECIQL